ncbi:hypothetical protein B0H19DRAFT_75183 [Mycena capillaripes]|nr:hypothetical protein B0H19DRAFT_75183 [Mycena capillaripes]
MSTLQGVPLTLGPMIAGCMSAVGLSAIVGFQTFLYFQIYPKDKLRYKLLVVGVWLGDALHTIFICLTTWDYAIPHFGDTEHLVVINQWYPAHILTTLLATANANLFYTWRVHKMSKGNWYLTVPILMLCAARTSFGFILVYAQLKYRRWSAVYEHFLVVRALAFVSSAVTDIAISAARYYYLRELKQGYVQTQEVVDTVVVFTINDGLLTSAVAVTVMGCVLAMHTNFIWIGIFFNLAKLFANSILATLNLRNWYRHVHRPMGISLSRGPRATRNTVQMNHHHVTPMSPRTEATQDDSDIADIDIQVDKQVEYHVEMVDNYAMERRIVEPVDMKA